MGGAIGLPMVAEEEEAFLDGSVTRARARLRR